MPKFIAVHTIPKLRMEHWRKAVTQLEPLPEDVTWIRTYCDFKDGKFFCEWEAPSQERLEAGLRSLYVPLDIVYPVEVWDHARNEFEGQEEKVLEAVARI